VDTRSQEEDAIHSEASPLLNTSRRGSPDRHGERTHSPPAWNGLDDFAHLPWYRRPHVLFLIFPFAILAITYGATIVPLIGIVRSLLCRDMLGEGTDSEVCLSNKAVSAQIAIFQLYAQAISGFLSAITSPYLGAWSDRFGRLRMLAITSLGMLAKDAFILALFYSGGTISVWWLLVAYALDGICGSFTAGMAISHAYASDCTSPLRRATAFGWFHGALFTGIGVGPLLAAFVVEATGRLIVVFYIATAAHIFYISMLLVIPESLSKRRQLEAQDRYATEKLLKRKSVFPDSSVAELNWITKAIRSVDAMIRGRNPFEPLKILWPTGPGTSFNLRKNLVILAAIDTISFGVAVGAVTVLIVYLGDAFSWDTAATSKFVSVVNISRVTCLLVVLPLINRIVRGSSNSPQKAREAGADSLDLAVIRMSIVFDTVGFAGYALAPTGAWITVAGIVASIGGIGSPTLQSALTKHVPPAKVGQLLGATGLLHALARIVTPVVFNLIYAKTNVDMPATVFVVLAVCFGVALLCSLFLTPGVYYDSKATEEEEASESEPSATATIDAAAEEEEALI